MSGTSTADVWYVDSRCLGIPTVDVWYTDSRCLVYRQSMFRGGGGAQITFLANQQTAGSHPFCPHTTAACCVWVFAHCLLLLLLSNTYTGCFCRIPIPVASVKYLYGLLILLNTYTGCVFRCMPVHILVAFTACWFMYWLLSLHTDSYTGCFCCMLIHIPVAFAPSWFINWLLWLPVDRYTAYFVSSRSTFCG